ncbi:MAG: PQQ-binding-like beta-propeller repeat protein [Lentisphaeria bacterium]|nr:PQQ-binding-like beta-propeller repeat protein [Lentisphaeria bacterium]
MARACAVSSLLALVVWVHGDESWWNRFRGAGGLGLGSGSPPVSWSESLHIRWRTALPGKGWSSPVLEGSRVWVTAGMEEGRSLRALAVDAATGALVHDIEVFAPEHPDFANPVNSHATPTPVTESGRVYVSFGNMGTACIEGESGSVAWRSQALRLDHKEGAGSSPILWGDLLILDCDGTDEQYIAALAKGSGEVVWRTPRSAALAELPFDQRKAYGTPSVLRVGGKEVLVSCSARRFYGYDPATGRELWYVEHEGFNNSQVPLPAMGNLLLGTGWFDPVLMSVRFDAAASGNLTRSHVLWTARANVPKLSSVLVLGDRIFMVSDNGVASWLDARDGRLLWRKKIAGRAFASPVSAAGRIYVFGDKGEGVVLDRGDPPTVIAENRLETGCMATPALVDDALIVRTKTHLYRIEASAPQREGTPPPED